MKKSLKFLVIGFAFFLTFAFNAKAEETNEPSLENAYVIGTHLFTEDGGVQLDIQTIMLAAKSITGDSLEDMVIYYKPAGEDRWLDAANEFAVVNTPDGVTDEGTIEEIYFTYIDLVPQEEAIEAAKKIELVSANTIKTDALDGDIYAENIKFNQAAIDITSNGNVVTINENIGMHSYENSSKATEQWYAVLLDLNIPKEYVETAAGSGYIIEAVDKDASNLGATGNQFVVWLRGSDEDTSRVITFVDNRTDEAVAVTFNFNGIAYTEYAADAEITVNTEGVTYTDGQFNYTSGTTAIEYTENGVSKKLVLDGDAWVPAFVMNGAENVVVPEFAEGEAYAEDMAYNLPKVDVSNDGNIITIVETDLLKAYNNGHANGEWFGFILDLGVNPANISSDKYGIAEVDYKDAHRFGATSDTAFVMWLTEENFATGNLEFTFKTGSEEITITLVFDGITGVEYDARGDITSITNDVTYDTERSMFIVPLEVNEFTFVENSTEYTMSNIEGVWKVASTFAFVDATEIDVNGIASVSDFASYAEELKANQDRIDVTYDVTEAGISLNVAKSEDLTAFARNDVTEKWYAVIVDLGISPALLKVDGAVVDDDALVQAQLLGARSNSAFVVWLDGERGTSEVTFSHISNENVSVTLNVNVEATYPLIGELNVNKLNFVDETLVNDKFYTEMNSNNNNIDVTLNENVITVTENAPLISYNNGHVEGKWFGIVVDFGIDPTLLSIDNYTIEAIDITDAHRFGAESETAFVMWLSDKKFTDNVFTTTITNKGDSTDTYSLTINFEEAAVATTREEFEAFIADDSIDTIFIGADISDLTSRIVVNRPVTIEGQGHTLSFTDAINGAADGYRHGLVIENVKDAVVVNNLKVTMNAVQDQDMVYDSNWNGVYAIQAYNSKNVTLKDITVSGADGGILVNSSVVTLDGTITLNGNEFGGIEVSKGDNVDLSASTLNINGATLAFENESYPRPTIWIDGLNAGNVINGADNMFTNLDKEDQNRYYLDEGKSQKPSISGPGEGTDDDEEFVDPSEQQKPNDGEESMEPLPDANNQDPTKGDVNGGHNPVYDASGNEVGSTGIDKVD